MSRPLVDYAARERFRTEWERNFAVSANAGSGKTTAISERLAAMALATGAAERLRKTAVVTYTKKAATQIGQRARQVLLRRINESNSGDLAPLDHLERAFFGTIHSFCLKLAQRYGQTVGINLNPTVVAESDDALWEEFVEQDAMEFTALSPSEFTAFLRHVPLEEIFPFARELDQVTAEALRARAPTGALPAPADAACEQLLDLVPKGNGRANLLVSQERARAWREAWAAGDSFLPLYEPAGGAKAVVECAQAWMAPLKRWLADAAAALAAELAERYRAWRFDRGVQTYADQIDAAMAVLRDGALLDRIRGEGWRIVLDEAQDTDPQQFAVLVEIARPVGAKRGAWPGQPGAQPPRPGHFCMVGDGQQAIYGSRADIGNFSRHVEAFRRGEGGELLQFQVTFRAPQAVIGLLNQSLPPAFGSGRQENFGLPPEAGAPAPFLQVPYVPLEPGPENAAGLVRRFALEPASDLGGVQRWLEEEARQLATWLHAHGPEAVGATSWGDVAVLAPRNDWLLTARKAFENAGLEVALQTRRNRCGDNPAYAWLTGLLAVCADPENMFEWTGVLREIFGVSDAVIAAEIRAHGRLSWEEPEVHAEPLAAALATVRPFVLRTNDEGQPLERFARELIAACSLRERAWRLDASGGVAGELDRLLAAAAQAGLEGEGPRAWLEELLHCIDDGRPAGKPSREAINLLTSHSAKGLEWPVVIVIGLWRGIGQAPERGLKLVRDQAGGPRVYFDAASLPGETKDARNRERVRELARLLYVTLTRARTALILPWADGFGGRQRETPSFAALWGMELGALEQLTAKPTQLELEMGRASADAVPVPTAPATPVASVRRAPPLPARLLPHELAHQQDLTRRARHDSGLDSPPAMLSEEAIDYGLWWHETLEFLPWTDSDPTIAAYGERAIATAAAQGHGGRAAAEWARLTNGPAWRHLCDRRWTRLAELGVFAPLRGDAWIDGVIDLVLHDPAANEVWIVDWKTNRRRAHETEDALLERLAGGYAPQLRAYGECVGPMFRDAAIRLLVFSSAVGDWREVAAR